MMSSQRKKKSGMGEGMQEKWGGGLIGERLESIGRKVDKQKSSEHGKSRDCSKEGKR